MTYLQINQLGRIYKNLIMLISVVLIDVVNKQIKEITIENSIKSIKELLGCRLIKLRYEHVFTPERHFLMCDEYGLLNQPKGGFKIGHHNVIGGNALICAFDDDVNLIDHYVMMEEIIDMVKFVNSNYLPDPNSQVSDWIDFN